MLHGGSKSGWKQLGRLLSVIWVRLGSDPSGKYHHQYSHSETTTSTSEDFRAGNVQPQGSFRFRLGELPRGDRGAHGSRLHSSGRDPQSQFRSDRSRSSEPRPLKMIIPKSRLWLVQKPNPRTTASNIPNVTAFYSRLPLKASSTSDNFI